MATKPQRKIIILDSKNEAKIEKQANLKSGLWDRVISKDTTGYRKLKDINILNKSKRYLVICEKD